MYQGSSLAVLGFTLTLTARPSIKIFLYSYIGFLLPIVRKVTMSISISEFDTTLIGIFTMPRRSHSDKHTLSSCLGCRLCRWKCRRPSRSYATANWKFWKILNCTAQLERHREHCCHFLFHILEYPGFYSVASDCSKICILITGHCRVSSLLSHRIMADN